MRKFHETVGPSIGVATGRRLAFEISAARPIAEAFDHAEIGLTPTTVRDDDLLLIFGAAGEFRLAAFFGRHRSDRYKSIRHVGIPRRRNFDGASCNSHGHRSPC